MSQRVEGRGKIICHHSNICNCPPWAKLSGAARKSAEQFCVPGRDYCGDGDGITMS
ncbi:hypothetical protein T4D_6351 [Trichinella pseudospiralis]|uniref:Uncharacterized protein n=1 Tax=Trichinella pseudospiralis TaxID=6337 RepID=A0A0V1FNZ7_TRIPS|nr:hypothetical protein T4D_6351 [Trichinella pseudospiralis]